MQFLSGCNGGGSNGSGDDEIFYVAFGASDATGIGAIPISEGYVFLIQEELDDETERGADLLNLGIPGAEINLIEEEVDIYLSGVASDIFRKPDLITIWTGSNDIVAGVDPEDFEEDFEDILMELTEETDAFIVTANIPDLTQLPRFMQNPDPDVTLERVMMFNEIIENQAASFGVPVVDLFSVMITEDFVFDFDGFHPSNEGHEMIAELFLEFILPEFAIATAARRYLFAVNNRRFYSYRSSHTELVLELTLFSGGESAYFVHQYFG